MEKIIHSTRSSGLLAAAGQGTRLGLGPKAFLKLGRRTLLEIATSKLIEVCDQVVVAAPPGLADHAARLLPSEVEVIEGGESREDTLMKLAAVATGELLLYQFVARPFASAKLHRAVLKAAGTQGAATACARHSAPIGLLGGGHITLPNDHAHLRAFQTPRAIRRDTLLEARNNHAEPAGLDICTPYQTPLAAVAGEESNIKITSKLDWDIARKVIAPRLGLV